MATIGRTLEPLSFLKSLNYQNYQNFEVIIVDQNNDNKLKEGIENIEQLNYSIQYIKIDAAGLSYARNKAIDIATGEVLAFPDDDCEYLPDTLVSVYSHFKNDTTMDVVKGKIVDREGKNSLKNWGERPFVFKSYKVFFKASSVTMFIKKKGSQIKFDEELGAGSTFGSCEDVDLIYRLLRLGKKICFFPDVKIYHPNENIQGLTKEKIWNYGRGFGAYTRKNLTISNFFVFVALICFHTIKGISALFMFNLTNANKRWWYIKARIVGFLTYGNRN